MSKDINTAPFRVGEEVICVDDSQTIVLVMDKKYLVLDVRNGCCGQEIWVGHKDPLDDWNCQECGNCGTIQWKDGDRIWFRAARFCRPQYQSVIQEILEKYPISERIETDIEVVVNN